MSINALNTDHNVVTVANVELLAQHRAQQTTADAVPVSPSPSEEPVLSRSEVESSIGGLNALLHTAAHNLSFSLDESTGTMVLKVINTDNGDLVRQIPDEEALRLMKHARDALDQSIAFLLDEKV